MPVLKSREKGMNFTGPLPTTENRVIESKRFNDRNIYQLDRNSQITLKNSSYGDSRHNLPPSRPT